MIVEDGTIYIGSGKCLYAISNQNGVLANSPWPVVGQNLKHSSCCSDIYLKDQLVFDN